MTRIVWTKEERNIVATRAFEIRSNTTTESDIDCVRQAMTEMLSTEKQRELRGMSDLPWIQEHWRILTKDAQSKSSKVQAIQAVVNPKVEFESFPERSLKDVPTMELWAELGSRINELMSGDHLRKMIREELNSTLERRLPGLLPPDEFVEQPQQEERQAKIKICVIGLLNGQQELIKREYADKVVFLFFDKTPSLHKIQQTAQQYDFVVQMLKFSNQIKGANQIERFHMLGGLLTQLRDFINRQVSQASR